MKVVAVRLLLSAVLAIASPGSVLAAGQRLQSSFGYARPAWAGAIGSADEEGRNRSARRRVDDQLGLEAFVTRTFVKQHAQAANVKSSGAGIAAASVVPQASAAWAATSPEKTGAAEKVMTHGEQEYEEAADAKRKAEASVEAAAAKENWTVVEPRVPEDHENATVQKFYVLGGSSQHESAPLRPKSTVDSPEGVGVPVASVQLGRSAVTRRSRHGPRGTRHGALPPRPTERSRHGPTGIRHVTWREPLASDRPETEPTSLRLRQGAVSKSTFLTRMSSHVPSVVQLSVYLRHGFLPASRGTLWNGILASFAFALVVAGGLFLAAQYIMYGFTQGQQPDEEEASATLTCKAVSNTTVRGSCRKALIAQSSSPGKADEQLRLPVTSAVDYAPAASQAMAFPAPRGVSNPRSRSPTMPSQLPQRKSDVVAPPDAAPNPFEHVVTAEDVLKARALSGMDPPGLLGPASGPPPKSRRAAGGEGPRPDLPASGHGNAGVPPAILSRGASAGQTAAPRVAFFAMTPRAESAATYFQDPGGTQAAPVIRDRSSTTQPGQQGAYALNTQGGTLPSFGNLTQSDLATTPASMNSLSASPLVTVGQVMSQPNTNGSLPASGQLTPRSFFYAQQRERWAQGIYSNPGTASLPGTAGSLGWYGTPAGGSRRNSPVPGERRDVWA